MKETLSLPPSNEIVRRMLRLTCTHGLCHSKTPQNQQKEKGGKKGERGREPTIVIVFFHRTTIDGESSQKLNKIGKTFLSRCGVYLAISRKKKSIKQKTTAGESEEKDKTFSAMWKKTKVFSNSSPF
jgi:hypothetical protein